MNGSRKARAYAGTLLILTACTLLAALMQRHFDSAGLTMVYLLGIVVVAVAFGRGPAVAASVLSVAVFDFAFVPPRFTFEVADTQYLVVFAVMLVVAVTTGTLTARLREQREESRAREKSTAALYRLTHDLAVRSTISGVLEAAVDRVTELFDARTAAWLPDARSELSIVAGARDAAWEGPDRSAAWWAFSNGQMAGTFTGLPAGARGIHLPLVAGTRTLGVLSLDPSEPRLWRGSLELLRAMASQTALAMERCRLAEEAQRVRAQIEMERTRSSLLSSISHDLRTPLAAIAGAASSLGGSDGGLSATARADLAATISEEAERLDRLIGNLLEMTRVESGALLVKKEWHSIEDVVGAALGRLERTLEGRIVQVSIPDDLPLVPVDDVLLETVVRNLLENAHKYSDADAPIEIAARVEGSSLRLDVADRGGGLGVEEEGRVFEKFYRGGAARALPGVGLGLAICKGIVEAHGGMIEASNRQGGGAVFTVRLPLEGEPPEVEREGAGIGEPGASP